MRVVLDTSVLVAAARSKRGASFALVSGLPSPAFQIAVSVTLYIEWQAVLTRPANIPPGLQEADVRAFLQYLASVAHLQDVHYLWRPFLRDPDDDLVLECAVASGSRYVVTHNVRDFRRSEELGVTPITPSSFISLLREYP